MPDCSLANIARIAGSIGVPDETQPVSSADVDTLFACASSQEDGAAMAASLTNPEGRGPELTKRAQRSKGITGFGGGGRGVPFNPEEPIVTPGAGTAGPSGRDPRIEALSTIMTPGALIDPRQGPLSEAGPQGQAGQTGAETARGQAQQTRAWQAANAKLAGEANPFGANPEFANLTPEAVAAAPPVGPGSPMPSSAELFNPTLSAEEVQQQMRDQIGLLGGDEWLANAGVTTAGLANVNPGANPGTYLRMYAKSQGLPESWANQNSGLYATLPGLYALNNPANPGLLPAQVASMADELGPGGLLGTPGEYLSAGAEWDKLMSPGATMEGGMDVSEIALLPPDDQVKAVSGGFNMLRPYMTPQVAQAVDQRLGIAIGHWNDAQATGYTGDLFTFLRDVEGAEEWV